MSRTRYNSTFSEGTTLDVVSKSSCALTSNGWIDLKLFFLSFKDIENGTQLVKEKYIFVYSTCRILSYIKLHSVLIQKYFFSSHINSNSPH